jgi:hypothetical protein
MQTARILIATQGDYLAADMQKFGIWKHEYKEWKKDTQSCRDANNAVLSNFIGSNAYNPSNQFLLQLPRCRRTKAQCRN